MSEVITLEEVKGHLRLELDETDDDVNLERFRKAADEYVKGTTGFLFDDPNNIPYRVKLAALMLVEHWDKNRGVQIEGMTTTAPLDFAVRQLLGQVLYTYTGV
jgi:uncharacterized phage protein (predicted DNA packaging)